MKFLFQVFLVKLNAFNTKASHIAQFVGIVFYRNSRCHDIKIDHGYKNNFR